MATDLTGLQVRNTYNSLLKIGDNTSLTGTSKRISDGLGNESPLFISTSQISIGVAPATGYDLTVNSGIRTGSIDVLGAATAQSLQFTGGSGTQATMSWNTDEETVDLIQNGATLQLGQETHVHVKNQSGATINDGTPVYVTGTLGASGRLTVAPMIADGSIEAKYFLGVTTEDIPNGEDGKVTTFGKIRGLNTSAYAPGTTLYVSSTTAGFWQTTPPVSPALDLEVAIVINQHANNGTIFVRATNGQYLGMLHDVYLNSVSNNQFLVYNSTNSRWENQGIASIGAINLDTVTDNGNTTTNNITVGDINAGNVTLTGYLRGAANFVIDPAAHGDETGVVQILGDLRVDGTTTTINSTTVTINDKNIVLAEGSALPGDANGAGITIDGANASMTYNSTSDRFVFNKDIETNLVGNVTGDLTGNADTASALETARNIAVDGAVTGNADFDGSGDITITTTVNHNHDDRYYTETESDNRFINVDGDTMTGDLNLDGGVLKVGNVTTIDTSRNIFANDITANELFATSVDFEDLFLTNASGASLAFRNSVGNTVNTDNLATVSFQGYYDSAFVGASRIQVKANEDFSATARGTVINFDFWDTGSTYDTIASIDSSGLYIGTTNVYDNLPDGITYSDTDNRLKIGVSKNVGSTTETAIQPILLADILNDGFIPYIATGGAGSATVNSRVSDSWLKINSDTLELGASDPVSHQIRYARFLWQAGTDDKISTVYGAKDITASIQYLGGSTTAKIEFTTGTGAGRIRINDTYSLPSGDGASGQVLGTDGAGDLAWVSGAATTSDLQVVTDNGATTTNTITTGGLVIGDVSWNSNKVRIEGSSPNIEFRGTDAGDIYWQLGSNGDSFYILDDANKDGTFDGSPYPFQLDNANTQLQVFGNRVLTTADEGSGNGLDADTIDGLHASAFASSSHTHDDRYYTESEIQTFFDRGYLNSHSASNLAVGWYTIATNTGNRALAEFQIWDTASSDHQSVLFNASHHYGNDTSNDITVLANSRYSGTNFRYIRIKDGGTYDGAALQVYVDGSTNSVNVAIVGGNAQASGWQICDWVPDATTPPNVSNYSSFGVRCQVDLDQVINGGIITTGEIYSGGASSQFRVLNTGDEGSGNGLDADTVDGLQASQFLRSDTSDTMVGVLTVNSGSGNNPAIFQSTDSVSYITIKDNTAETRLVNVGSDFQIEVNNGNPVAKFFSNGDLTIYGDDAPKVQLYNRFVTGDWSGITDLGTIEWYTPDTSGNAPYTTGFISNVNETGGTLPSGALSFGITQYNAAGGAIETFRLKSNRDAYFTHNLGIGTTSPAYTLDVNGTARSSKFVSLVNTDRSSVGVRDWLLVGTYDRAGAIEVGDISGARYAIWGGGYDLKFGKHISTTDTYVNVMQFLAANATDTSVDVAFTSGNVGIGTTSPAAKLHAFSAGTNNVQEIVAVLGSTSTRPVLQFSESTAGTITAGMSLEYNGNGSGDNNYFVINSVANVPRFTVMSGGNVGIGTTSPDRNLHVKGSTFGAAHIEGTTGDAFLEFTTANNNAFIGVDDSLNVLKINNTSTLGGAVHLAVRDNGWLGIGTDDPQDMLHLKSSGDVQIRLEADTDNVGEDDNPSILLVQDGGAVSGRLNLSADNNLQLINQYDGAVQIGQNNTPNFTIDNTGKFAFGSALTTASHFMQLYDATPWLCITNTAETLHGIRFEDAQAASTQYSLFGYNCQTNHVELHINGTKRFQFNSDGKFHADNDIIAFSTTTSDARLKDDIKTIDNALDKVMNLRGVSYTWNNGSRKGQKDLGVIAQEVEQVIPEIVREHELPLMDDSGEKYKTVDYEKMVGVLIEAMKEQQKQIDELKARLDA